MTPWEQRFQSHAIWTSLQELRAALDETDRASVPDVFDQVNVLTERVAAYRRGADPISFTPDMLEPVDGIVRQLLATYREMIDEEGDPSVVALNTDNLTQAISGWPALLPEGSAEATERAVDRVTSAASEAVEGVGKERARLEKTLADLATQISVAQEQLTTIDVESKTQIQEQTRSWTAALTARQDESGEVMGELRSIRDEARRVLHETTGDATGTEYDVYAAGRRRTAYVYDAAAAAFGLGGLIVLLIFLHDNRSASNPDALVVAARLGVTTGAIIIGGFLASRGALEHKEAREAKRTALALSRMSPFIVNLPRDAQEVLTVETADRIFTRGELGRSTDRDPVMDKLQKLRLDRQVPADDE